MLAGPVIARHRGKGQQANTHIVSICIASHCKVALNWLVQQHTTLHVELFV